MMEMKEKKFHPKSPPRWQHPAFPAPVSFFGFLYPINFLENERNKYH
jgi:hypothetical protein